MMNSPNSDHGDGTDEEPMNYDSDNGGDYEEDALMDEEDAEDYYDDDDIFADNNGGDVDDDKVDPEMLKLQAQFDKADLPPGVEASFSLVPPRTNSVEQNFLQGFKSFDVVDDFPDHYYKTQIFGGQPSKQWTKKVQDDWRLLEKDLPENIYARACESRMDLMRAAMAGPQGTPYHDSFFVFDIHFPPEYPKVPPLLNYHSGGLRINPNLYNCGKVCLSLLNTWYGSGCEMWQPGKSTMLQVLVSIQALILNDKPYFNEPSYEQMFKGPEGEQNCIEYSENVLLLSIKTMFYTINRPPKHFEDLVVAHFATFGHDFLAACKAYLAGAPIGSVVKGEFPEDKKIKKLRTQILFNIDLAKQMNKLVPIFTKFGAKGCDKFLIDMYSNVR